MGAASSTLSCARPASPPDVVRTLSFGVLALALIVAGCRSAGESEGPAAPVTSRKRLLVVTHSTGFRHSSIPDGEAVLQRLGDAAGLDVSHARDGAGVARLLSSAALAGVDVVAFVNTTGDLGLPDPEPLLAWIRAGHAFLGVHAASDTYLKSDAFLEMIGGRFASHGPNQADVEITVEDPSHPAVAHLTPRFRITDEIYEFTSNPRDRARILLSLDRHPGDGHPEAGRPGDFPLAWEKSYGAGRVFYTALGHREDVWSDPRFQQHLTGALHRLLGRR